MARSRSVLLVALAAVFVACGERTGLDLTRTDSAGVEIVTTRVVGARIPPIFRVGGAPVVDLGLVGVETDFLRSVLAGALLDSGDLALVTADGTLARFDPSGGERWHTRIGAVDLAPGPGDSVTVLVGEGDSLAVVGPSGEVRRIDLAWAGVQPLGDVIPWNGGFVSLTGWSSALLSESVRPGVREDPAHLLAFGPEGELRDTLATVPGDQIGLVSLGGRITIAPPHFARVTLLAADGDRLWLAPAHADEIIEFGASGVVTRRIRRVGRPLGITTEDSAAAALHRTRLVGQSPLSEALARALDEALPMPASRPPYAQLVPGDEGRLWVADYPLPGEVPAEWTVHGPEGELLGSVSLPVRFRLLDVGGGRVLGRVLGGDGAVQVYEVRDAEEPTGG